MDAPFDVEMSGEGRKTFLVGVNSLCNCVDELWSESVSEHEITALAPVRDNDLVWTHKVLCEGQKILGLFRLHGGWILDEVGHV